MRVFDMHGRIRYSAPHEAAVRCHECTPTLFGTEYGVPTITRIDQIIGLFCKTAILNRRYSAKETYHFIDATDRSRYYAEQSHHVIKL